MILNAEMWFYKMFVNMAGVIGQLLVTDGIFIFRYGFRVDWTIGGTISF